MEQTEYLKKLGDNSRKFMMVKIDDTYRNFISIRIETKTYLRTIHFSKINYLKYSDIKLMKDYRRIFKKTIENKWVSVDPGSFIDKNTNQLSLRKFLMSNLIRNPFLRPKDPNMKVVDITKYIYAWLICSVGFAIFACIYCILIVFI